MKNKVLEKKMEVTEYKPDKIETALSGLRAAILVLENISKTLEEEIIGPDPTDIPTDI